MKSKKVSRQRLETLIKTTPIVVAGTFFGCQNPIGEAMDQFYAQTYGRQQSQVVRAYPVANYTIEHRVKLLSEPSGSDIYSLRDPDLSEVEKYIGKTPFECSIINWNLTIYSDNNCVLNGENKLPMTAVGEVTVEPDGSLSKGIVKFSFLFKKPGYSPEVGSINLAIQDPSIRSSVFQHGIAMHRTQLPAPYPGGTIKVYLEKEK